MRCELARLTCLALGLAASACSPPRPAARPEPPPPALSAPGPIAPSARGAALLAQLAAQLQPEWAQFLEDCRTRLPRDHVLNRPTLVATAELAIDRTGHVALVEVRGSGVADFDRALTQVVATATRVRWPDEALVSDDDAVHVRWLFARDRRQAGAATAEVFDVALPLADVVGRLLDAHQLPRAIKRLARAPATDPARAAVTERVMIEVLRDELASTKAAGARRAAADAIAHARVSVLAPALHDLVAPTIAAELRLAAITAAATLDDRSVTGELVAALPADLADDPRVAVASVSALVQLGQRAAAEAAIRRATPHPAALAALAVVRVPALDAKLEAWFARGGVGTRAAVCAALVTPATRALLLRGLRDPDASVRAACAATAATLGARGAGRAVVARLRELARDRDHLVRAQAIAALAAVGGGRVAGAARDSAPEVRAAAAARATDDELVALAADPEPDVRAAAIAVLGARATKEARAAIARAATDEAPQVRRAAIPSITDAPALQRLAADDAPEVASDALVALVQRRGRAASTSALVARLAANAGDRERVRIALAWLLAPRP